MDERKLALQVEEARERLLDATPEQLVWASLKRAPGEALLSLLVLVGSLGGTIALASFMFGIEVPPNPLLLLIAPAGYLLWLFERHESGRLKGPFSLYDAPPTVVAKTYCQTFARGKNWELWDAMHYVRKESEARAFVFLNPVAPETTEPAKESDQPGDHEKQ
jgi:hypothetical protein